MIKGAFVRLAVGIAHTRTHTTHHTPLMSQSIILAGTGGGFMNLRESNRNIKTQIGKTEELHEDTVDY